MLRTGLDLVSSAYLLGLTFDCHLGCDLEFFENSDLFEFLFFSSKVFWSFYRVRDLLFLYSLFRWKYITDAMLECYVIVHEWDVCALDSFLCFFLFIKFAIFSPTCTLQAYWCSLFLLCLRRYFCLDTCLSHRILLFVFRNETFLFKPLSMKHKAFRLYALDFTTLVLSINFAWIMKNY